MKRIGFKNFRRFANFPVMELAPITIFVGENNSGKSTVVKGILALSDFFTRWRADYDLLIERNTDDEKKRKRIIKEKLADQKFYFNTSYLTHIGTFKRALYNKAEDNTISFHTSLGSMDIEINVKGDKDDEQAVSGTISTISVRYNDFGIQLDFDLFNDVAKIAFYPHRIDETTPGILTSRYQKKIDDYFKSFDKPVEFETCLSDSFGYYTVGLIPNLVDSVESAINATIYSKKEQPVFYEKYSPIENLPAETVNFLKMYIEKVPLMIGMAGKRNAFAFPGSRIYYNLFDIEYLYAHAVTQTVIYSAKDTNDYLSRTIHEYASLPSQEYKHEFITKWMKKFGIGMDFKISSVGGEAHIVYIINNDGKSVNLADKGMGSIQLMVLLFSLAISLPQNTVGTRTLSYERIIIIEEPEQNLHPMLQSLLADLLFELNSEFGYRFIIETHSEYLIRKTQVIVKEKYKGKKQSFKNNPFKVYYFNASDSEKPYYEIVYQRDGSFENDFGKGFFDEASNLAFEIL